MQLALAPLIGSLDGPATVFGVSGYSGAGTTPSPKNDPERLRDNLMPYSLVGHVHEREASHHLGHPVRFLPHVAAFFRGISLTIAIERLTATTVDALREQFRAAYRDEPLVRVQEAAPEVREVAGRHHVAIGGFAVEGRRAVLVCALDNLRKGAATQALQNLLLALGLDERSAIEHLSR
jgi:N-acetyl-gamma-glutamylphosphate reductase